MEIEVVEKTDNRLLFRIKGESHTFVNILKDALTKHPDVDIAAYEIEHPLVGIPEVLVQTKKKDPVKVILETIQQMKKDTESDIKAIIKTLK